MARRATVQETIIQERRRRQPGTLDRTNSLKLAIPQHIRDANPGCEFRWINDAGNRMYFMTQEDDWSKVDSVNPIPVGTSPDGKPILAHLCKKPTEFWLEDQKAKMVELKEGERSLERGETRSPDDDRPQDVSYVTPGNSIKSGFTP